MTATVPAFDPTAPLPDGTLLLEASAGTGKTYTITSLVLRLVAEEGIDLDRVLVVTFTRAAAAELRGRIRGRLVEAAAQLDRAGQHDRAGQLPVDDQVVAHLIDGAADRGELVRRARRLRAATERFDDATIDTIHGFCQRTLQRAAPDVDLDLGAELTEDVQDLLDELVHDELVAQLRTAPPDWFHVLVSKRLGVARLRGVARALEGEPDLAVLPPRVDDDGTPLATRWVAILDRFQRAWREQGDELAAWLGAHADDRQYRGRNLAKRLEALDEWCRSGPGERDPDAIATPLKWFTRSFLQGRLDAALELPDHLDVVDAADEVLHGRDRLATVTLRRFAERVLTELPRRKVERGLTTFADQLVALDRALAEDTTRDAVRAGIRTRFDVALIDEFQDTDPVQWRIFDHVFGGDGALRLIGDPKQAIYGFRGADVHTYLRAKDAVPEAAHRTLSTNHRSDGRYLDALEQLLGRDAFGTAGIFGVPRIEHVPVAAAHPGDRLTIPGEQPHAPLELVFVPRGLHDPETDAGALINKGEGRELVVRLVAQEIVAFLRSGATLEDGRPVEPRDVAVLVRTNDQARRIQAALLDAGVPAVVGTDASVFDTPEARTLQQLLDALLAPSDARTLRTALTGPLLGVAARDLVRDGTDDHLDTIDRWLGTWRRAGTAALLRQVFAEAGTIRRLVGERRGERRLTNLVHLAELLHGAEAASRLGPEGVAAWLREQRHAEAASPEERQLRLESDEDAVTVATVHRAKGLQYGVVWCPFLWTSLLTGKDAARVLRFHDPATGVLSLDLATDVEGGAKAEHLAVATRQQWEEELRLLYVALTRAKHRCVVHTGAFAGAGSSPLYRLLHGADFGTDDAGLPTPPADPKGISDDELRAELQALVSPEVAVRDAQELPCTRWAPAEPVKDALQVRAFGRPLDRTWQRTSFSRMTAGAHAGPDVGGPQDDGIDHDEVDLLETVAVTGLAEVTLDTNIQVPLATFPRGPEAGTFLHTVLEHLDFTIAGDHHGIRAAIDRHADPVVLGTFDRDRLAAALRRVVTTPLGAAPGERADVAHWPDGGCLSDVSRYDRLDELAFDLPLAGGYAATGVEVTLHRIAEVLAQHAAASPAPLAAYAQRLRARPAGAVRGFLTGSIDLLLRVWDDASSDARHLVIDHKSNWLGAPDGTSSSVAHYHPDRLAYEMVAHDYVLQYHLYVVAVHRFLRWRLGERYDYDRHVAGVRYLFLRGMVGPDTPRTGSGGTHGVYADRPTRALVEDLDDVLAGVRP